METWKRQLKFFTTPKLRFHCFAPLGKGYLRDIECDVWIAETEDTLYSDDSYQTRELYVVESLDGFRCTNQQGLLKSVTNEY